MQMPFVNRLRVWLNHTQTYRGREQLYTVIIIMAVYGLALLGGAVIGATSYGIFVFGGILALFVGMFIGLYPEYGLYILIFFVFTNMSDVLEVAFGIPDSNKLLVGLLLVGTLASRIVIHNRPIIFRATEILILAVGMVMALSLLFGIDQSEMNSIMFDWFKDFVILFIIVQLCIDENVWKNAQWSLVVGAAFLAIFSVYHTISGDTSNDFYGLAKAPVHEITTGFDSTRITGPLDDPNYYAMIHLMAFPMSVYLTLSAAKPYTRVFAGICSLLIMATILFTFSRGAFLSLVVVGILIIRERKWNPYKIAFGGLLLFGIMSPFMPAGFTDRLDTLTGLVPSGGDARMQTESSFRGRTSELLVALMMYEDHPILGVGKYNYANAYLDYSSSLGLDDRLEDRQAHSLYFETLAEQGTVGFMVFMLMLFVVWQGGQIAKQTLRDAHRDDLVLRINGAQFGLIGYLLASIFLHADYERYLWLSISMNVAGAVMANQQLELSTKTFKKSQQSTNQSVALAV